MNKEHLESNNKKLEDLQTLTQTLIERTIHSANIVPVWRTVTGVGSQVNWTSLGWQYLSWALLWFHLCIGLKGRPLNGWPIPAVALDQAPVVLCLGVPADHLVEGVGDQVGLHVVGAAVAAGGQSVVLYLVVE